MACLFHTFATMQIEFYKYQGTGNDFIIVDNRQLLFPKNNTNLIAQLCDRKFGIGADGFMLLENHPTAHFTMVYYNADGRQSSMCGNGGRCIVHFAAHLGIIEVEGTFEAIDGMHTAKITPHQVALKMNDVSEILNKKTHAFLDTGSPHHVQLVTAIDDYPVFEKGKHIRNTLYGSEGANVNFVTPIDDITFKVRTYERGVEDETLSCGTGVTAVALAMYENKKTTAKEVVLQTPGGTLKVSFEPTSNGFQNIYLKGPATQVFKGNIVV